MTKDKNLNEIQELVFQEYIKNGYLDFWSLNILDFFGLPIKTYKKLQKIADIAEIGFFTTEIGESIENRFKNKSNFELGLECADIIIRILNFMSRKNLNATFFILEKHKQNLKRGLLHGKTV